MRRKNSGFLYNNRNVVGAGFVWKEETAGAGMLAPPPRSKLWAEAILVVFFNGRRPVPFDIYMYMLRSTKSIDGKTVNETFTHIGLFQIYSVVFKFEITHIDLKIKE